MFPLPKQSSKSSNQIFTTIITIIITGAVVAGAMFIWQNVSEKQGKEAKTEELEQLISEQKDALLDYKEKLAESQKTLKEAQDKFEGFEKLPNFKALSLGDKSFKDYFALREDFEYDDPMRGKDVVYAAEGVGTPCIEYTQESCGFEVAIIADADWESSLEKSQKFFIREDSVAGHYYYGPFEDNLEKLIQGLKEMEEELKRGNGVTIGTAE